MWDPTKEYRKTKIFMNCHLAITRVMFAYLIDACVLRRKLNRRFHNKRRMRDLQRKNLSACAVMKEKLIA